MVPPWSVHGIRHLAIAAHDHTIDLDLPDGDGVVCRIVSSECVPKRITALSQRSSGCSIHPLLCSCPQRTQRYAQINTQIVGSSTADVQGSCPPSDTTLHLASSKMPLVCSVSCPGWICFNSGTHRTGARCAPGNRGRLARGRIGCCGRWCSCGSPTMFMSLHKMLHA